MSYKVGSLHCEIFEQTQSTLCSRASHVLCTHILYTSLVKFNFDAGTWNTCLVLSPYHSGIFVRGWRERKAADIKARQQVIRQIADNQK